MRNRTWSDVVMAAMIALCVAIVAEPRRQAPVSGIDSTASSIASSTASSIASSTASDTTHVADSARSLAYALLLGAKRHDVDPERAQLRSAVSATDRAVANAAAAAGSAARDIEMPFFSFGGDASAE